MGDIEVILVSLPSIEDLQPQFDRLKPIRERGLAGYRATGECNFARVTQGWFSKEERKAFKTALERARKKRGARGNRTLGKRLSYEPIPSRHDWQRGAPRSRVNLSPSNDLLRLPRRYALACIRWKCWRSRREGFRGRPCNSCDRRTGPSGAASRLCSKSGAVQLANSPKFPHRGLAGRSCRNGPEGFETGGFEESERKVSLANPVPPTPHRERNHSRARRALGRRWEIRLFSTFLWREKTVTSRPCLTAMQR